MAEPAEPRMSLAAFLEWDDGTDTRYELIDGRQVAMAAADRGARHHGRQPGCGHPPETEAAVAKW